MVKLVDILAEELEEWPEGCPYAWQDYDGEVRFRESIPHNFVSPNVCNDHMRVPGQPIPKSGVTRAKWQAARDALLAKESPSLHAQAVGRVTRVSGWVDGELPPVGTICEVKRFCQDWVEVEVIAHFQSKAMVAAFVPVCGEVKHVDQAIAACFRPIRTPEQIAAEEKAKAIEEIRRDTDYILDETCAAAVLAAGYRKQEPK